MGLAGGGVVWMGGLGCFGLRTATAVAMYVYI